MSASDFEAAACTGKKTYRFHHARRLASQVSRRHDGPMHHYHCTWCNGWHIGRPLSGAKRHRNLGKNR